MGGCQDPNRQTDCFEALIRDNTEQPEEESQQTSTPLPTQDLVHLSDINRTARTWPPYFSTTSV